MDLAWTNLYAGRVEPADDFTKVRFRLDQNGDGWPPVTSEGLWATQVGPAEYLVENTPWFARGLAPGDVVAVEHGEDGVLWATGVVQESGNLVVRVTPRPQGPIKDDLQSILDSFAAYDVGGEGALPDWPIVSLDIPADADLAAVKATLDAGVAEGLWDYDEGCVSDAWWSL